MDERETRLRMTLRAYRVAKGKTQLEVSHDIGMSRDWYTRAENRPGVIKTETLWKLADYYGIDITDFFNGFSQHK